LPAAFGTVVLPPTNLPTPTYSPYQFIGPPAYSFAFAPANPTTPDTTLGLTNYVGNAGMYVFTADTSANGPITFDWIDAFAQPQGVGGIVLADHLGHYGVSISNVTPGTSVVVQDYRNYSGVNGANPTTPPNLLTQIGPDGPMSFTLNIIVPQNSIDFYLPAVWGAPGIPDPSNFRTDFPVWNAAAYDANGNLIAQPTLPHPTLPSLPSRWYYNGAVIVVDGVVRPFPFNSTGLLGPGITSVQFNSDSTGSSWPSAVLLDNLYLPNNAINRIFSNGPFFADSAIRIAQITDGTSNVLLFGEALGGPETGPPTYGLTWMGAGVLPTYWDCQTPSTWFTFGSNHPAVVNFAFCDGSVRSISKIRATDPTTIPPPDPPGGTNSPRWVTFQFLGGINDNATPDFSLVGL
jgi:prepilin-type processing-associated H-X9-DG protein